MPAVLNGANEAAVRAFLAHEIKFTDIVKIVETTRAVTHSYRSRGSKMYRRRPWARETAHELMRG